MLQKIADLPLDMHVMYRRSGQHPLLISVYAAPATWKGIAAVVALFCFAQVAISVLVGFLNSD